MPTNVVSVGGGHGLARALAALRVLDLEPTAVVTVADDGGSSGRLRRDLDIIAPGDLRQALIALARNRELAMLWGHRFSRGELEGHALGNLALVALAEQLGDDFVAALEAAGALLDCAGRVLPSTSHPVQLKARVAGHEIGGQASVARAGGRVERVWLEPEAPDACVEAVAAIEVADAIVLGPGSLFTSVIAAVLVPGIAEAIEAARGRTVYVANLTTQPGETAGFSGTDHVTALLGHLPGLELDTVVVHEGPVPGGSEGVNPAVEHGRVAEVVRADVVSRDAAGRPTWGHDPERLAHVLVDVIGGPAP